MRDESAEPLTAPALHGRRIHIVGIGGVMMSAIARLLTRQGCTVSGSDLQESDYTRALIGEGITVAIGHDAANVAENVALVAISSAIPETNPEVVEARRRGLPVLKRADVLGQVVNARSGIAVAGTHGKTTTSSLIATLLTEGGLDPTFLIGSVLANYGTNCRVGGSDWVVVEADEYDRALLTLRPKIALVLNLEFDHPDIYRDMDDLLATFGRFVARVPADGLVLLNAGCANARSLVAAASARVETFGLAEELPPGVTADWTAGPGDGRFVVDGPGGSCDVPAVVLGRHGRLNLTAALATAAGAGLEPTLAAELLPRFRGVERRFETLCDVDGIRVIDDYAHHPTEVAATIAAARQLGGRLRVVYEPHQFARTRALIHDYAGVFDQAEATYICDIYRAREDDLSGVSSRQLADVAGGEAKGVVYVGTDQAARERLLADTSPGQVWLILGAGNITHLAHALAADLAG